jgi:trehalose utilization protein
VDDKTSLLEYNNALSGTYKITPWVTSEDGSLTLAELQEYDAIIWTTGDYWDDSIGDKDAQLLAKYVEAGGNLILSGASIAFDWDHTEFLSTVVHADYITFAEQEDLEPVLPDHAIAKGFEEDAVITFIDTPSGETLEPDVVSHTVDARVVMQRGPVSEEAGAPAVIAYEDDRSKVAYFAFPVYLLALEDADRLVNNTVNWFTRKPLDLPDEDDFEPYGDVDSGGEDEEESEEEPAAEDEEGTAGEEEGSGEESGEGSGDNGGS